MNYSKLVTEAVTNYLEELQDNPHNTDFILFESEEIGNREGMNTIQFEKYCDAINRRLAKLNLL